jgi:[acyl-carrier-protein] S-malonyltransferase
VRGEDVLVVANLNAPGQVVISGSKEACARVRTVAGAMGVRRVLPLNVAGAFHSPLMEAARQDLVDALAATTLRDASVPVISNVTAGPVTTAAEFRDLLSRQVTSPVLWEASMRRLVKDGFTEAVEAPPGTVLAGFMRKIAPEVPVGGL